MFTKPFPKIRKEFCLAPFLLGLSSSSSSDDDDEKILDDDDNDDGFDDVTSLIGVCLDDSDDNDNNADDLRSGVDGSGSVLRWRGRGDRVTAVWRRRRHM